MAYYKYVTAHQNYESEEAQLQTLEAVYLRR